MTSTNADDYTLLCSLLSGRGVAVAPSRWPGLVERALAESVAPLLYERLRTQGTSAGLPAPCLQALKDDYTRTAARNSLFLAEAGRLLRPLHEAHIPTVVLKGMDLAWSCYSAPALRPMSDIDLLIPEACLEPAIALVQGLGFTPEEAWASPPLRSGLRRLLFFEANFDGGLAQRTHVELHWSLVAPHGSRFSPQIEWFWEGTHPASRAGQETRVLAPTQNVLFLAAHLMLKHLAFKHGADRTRLIWFYDLHCLIEQHRDSIAWEELLGQAVRFEWQTALRQALGSIQERFGTPLPDGFLGRLAAQAGTAPVQIAASRQPSAPSRFRMSLEDLRELRGPARWRVFLALLIPGQKYMLWRYRPRPGWLWPLWYLCRWADILLDGSKLLFRRKVTQP